MIERLDHLFIDELLKQFHVNQIARNGIYLTGHLHLQIVIMPMKMFVVAQPEKRAVLFGTPLRHMQTVRSVEVGFTKNGNNVAHDKGNKSKTNRLQKGFVSMAKILRFTIITPIEAPRDWVWLHFNQDLLAAVKPPLSQLEFLRYEGQRKGNRIALRVFFLGKWVKQTWNTQIIADRGTCFVDSSHKPPAPLSYWHHVHAVLPGPNQSCRIVDRISFSCPYDWLAYLVYLPLFALFSTRRKGYRRYFGKLV